MQLTPPSTESLMTLSILAAGLERILNERNDGLVYTVTVDPREEPKPRGGTAS